jgi:hypothetical protein
MKPLFVLSLLGALSVLAGGCGKVEPTQSVKDAGASTNRSSKASPGSAAPSPSGDTAEEPKRPPAEDDPFPNGEPPVTST